MGEMVVGPEASAAAETSALARRYLNARGPLMKLVGALGNVVENQAERLPDAVKDAIETAIRAALDHAYAGARQTQRLGKAGRAHAVVTAGLGAAGGLGGLATAAVELPFTVTTILRAIQEIAADHGENLEDEEVRLACIQVFAAGGPLRADDGSDTTFLGARLAIAAGKERLIAVVLPRLSAVLGQKLAAQAVPVIGGVTGAAINVAFTRYYQDMAQVHFGLRRLARAGVPDPAGAFRDALTALRATQKT